MTLRVACLGAGYFAGFHHASWRRMDGVALVGVCDLDRSKAEATGATAFDRVADMLEVTKPDILDVIVPPQGHAEAIRAGLSAGVRAIICQKPFCASLAEAETITREAETAGVPLIVHENFRFQPWYRAIRRAIDAGDLGDVLNLTFRLRPGDGQGPRAYLDRQPYFQRMPRFLIHETGVHWIDTFRFLLGDATAVYADLRQLNPSIAGEDSGHVLFDHGPVRALLDGNRLLDHAAENHRRTMGEALVEGTAGTLTLTGDGAVHLRHFKKTDAQEILPPNTWDGFGGDCVHHLQTHVVDALRGGRPFENVAREYLTVIRVEDAVYRSAEEGRRIAL